MWFYVYLIATIATKIVVALPVQSQSSPEWWANISSSSRFTSLINGLTQNAQYLLSPEVQPTTSELSKRSPQSSGLVAVLGGLNNILASYGKKRPYADVDDFQTTPSTRFPDAIRRKVRYGPYRIPPTSERNVEYDMLGVSGMTNTFELNPLKPCETDCILLAMQASLEYGDGTEVPSNTSGAMLHHTVVVNRGVKVWDATCGKNSEHIFESGNERSVIPFYLPETGVKAGYHLRTSDKFAINTELMNMEDREKWVWLTLQFDLVEGFSSEYKESKVVWMSVGPDRCTGSVEDPFGATNLTKSQQPIKDVFEEYSSPWISPKSGLVIGSNSHLHNGGLDTQLYVEGSNICTSNAKYKKAKSTGSGHSHSRRQMGTNAGEALTEQLSEQEQCSFRKPHPISKGESMYIKTHYDFTKHPGMKNDKGELDEVMAIAGVLMVFDHEKDTNATAIEAPGNRNDGSKQSNLNHR